MHQLTRRLLSVATGTAAAAGLFAAFALAGPIEDRQALMKRNGESLKPMVAIAKKEAAFDAAVVAKNAGELSEDLIKAKDLFPDGSDKGEKETWAKPEIWAERAAFDQALNQAIEAAQALAAVTEEAKFMPALGAMGNGCKNCHDKFRRPKE